jgi:hypothetical protein
MSVAYSACSLHVVRHRGTRQLSIIDRMIVGPDITLACKQLPGFVHRKGARVLWHCRPRACKERHDAVAGHMQMIP